MACDSGKIYNLANFDYLSSKSHCLPMLFSNSMYSSMPGPPCLTGAMRKQPNGWPSKCLSLIFALCFQNLSWYIIKISATDPPSTEPQYLGCLQETPPSTTLRSMCQGVVKQKSCKSPPPRPSFFLSPFYLQVDSKELKSTALVLSALPFFCP